MSLAAHRTLYAAALQGGVSWLALDRFTTTAAAPLGTHVSEPGPGSLVVTDTNSIVSIAGGVLVVNGTAVSANSVASSATHARVAGRAFLLDFPTLTTVGNTMRWGWSTNSTDNSIDYGIDYSTTSVVRVKTGVSVILSPNVAAGVHHFCVVLRATGAFFLWRNGTSGAFTLAWVYNAGTAAEYAKLAMGAASVNYTADNWRVTDLGGVWTTDYGIATTRAATTANAETGIMLADAVVEHTITAATGVSQELIVRRTDDDNCWVVRMDQTGATVKLFERAAAVETERATAAQTWTNTTQYRVLVICYGTVIDVLVANVVKLSYASAVTNQTATGTKVSHAGTDLVAWPRTISLPTGV